MSKHTFLKPDRWKEDPELTLLLFLLREDATPRLDTVDAADLYGLDWARLLRLAEHHRVVPAVYLQLKRINHPAIPAELLRNLQAQYQRNTLRMLRLQAEAGRVTRLLMNHGIRVLMLKGPALAQQLYGDVSLRTSKDVDLLIAPDDMDQAEQWMQEAGYVSKSGEARVLGSWKWKDHHASFLHPHKRVEIELHWRLHPDAGGEPSFEDLWKHRQIGEVTATGVPCVYTLGSEHQFLYLSAHGARHGWFRLRWLVDIDRLAVRAVDWEALLPMMRRYGGLPAGGQAWALAAALLGTSIPEPLRQVAATRLAHRLALSALAFIQASVPAAYPVAEPATHQPGSRSYLLSLKEPSHRLLYLISRLLPSTGDPAVLPLPRQLHFLYIPLRPFLWLKRRFSKH
ncbi:nucleotidyltransferase family protein [Paenibacillus terrae]|nr:nucleotidyltransferase family protein [Paenibacillus terrae]